MVPSGVFIHSKSCLPGAWPGPLGLAGLPSSSWQAEQQRAGSPRRGQSLGRGWGRCRPLQPGQVWGAPYHSQGTGAAPSLDDRLAAPVQNRTPSFWAAPQPQPNLSHPFSLLPDSHCPHSCPCHRLVCTFCSCACVHTCHPVFTRIAPQTCDSAASAPPSRSSGSREQGERSGLGAPPSDKVRGKDESGTRWATRTCSGQPGLHTWAPGA